MIQLVQPDLSAKGTLGYCLEYASRGVFHNPASGSNAWNAWLGTQYKHSDSDLPSDVSVLVWFSYYTTINGIYGNYGHVGVNVPGQGIYCSPYQLGVTHNVSPSISAVEQNYRTRNAQGQIEPLTYVGWSEDILNLRVIGGTMIPEGEINDNDDIAELWRVAFFRDPTPQEIQDNQGLIGKYWNDACKYIRSTDAFHQVQAQYQAGATAEYVAYSGPQLYTKK